LVLVESGAQSFGGPEHVVEQRRPRPESRELGASEARKWGAGLAGGGGAAGATAAAGGAERGKEQQSGAWPAPPTGPGGKTPMHRDWGAAESGGPRPAARWARRTGSAPRRPRPAAR